MESCCMCASAGNRRHNPGLRGRPCAGDDGSARDAGRVPLPGAGDGGPRGGDWR